MYSSRFLAWENAGMQISPNLVQFAKELNEHTIALSEKECHELPLLTTRSASIEKTIIWLNYILDGYSENGVSYAMSISTFMDIVKEKFSLQRTAYGPFQVNNIQHYGFQMLKIDLYVTDFDYYDRYVFENLVQDILRNIKWEVWKRRFDVTIQYSYVLAAKPESEKTSSSTGGSGVFTGGTVSPSNGEGTEPELDKKMFEQDCIHNANKIYVDSVTAIMDMFGSTNVNTYPGTMPFADYLDKVHNDTVEYSTCFSSYPKDGYNTFSTAIRGDKYSVRNELTPSAVAEIHNHPNGSVPSFRDILYTAANANDPDLPKYKATFVYNQKDSSYYALYIKDAKKAQIFFENHKEELDEETNNYKKGGMVYRFLRSKGISMDAKYSLYAISAILGHFDSGISLHKIESHMTTITYDVVKKYNNNQKKYKLSFIICSN